MPTSPRDQEDMPGAPNAISDAEMWERAKAAVEKPMKFTQYRRTQIAEMTPWVPGFDMADVSVSVPDHSAGSPKTGDMIARNPKNPADKWLVAAQYFADNFESF